MSLNWLSLNLPVPLLYIINVVINRVVVKIIFGFVEFKIEKSGQTRGKDA